MDKKTCKTCGNEKAISEFYVRKSGKPYNQCKACHYAAGKARIEADPEKRKEICRRYYQTHKVKQNARTAEWRKQNPEKAKEINRRHFEKHRERFNSRAAETRKRLRDACFAAYGGYVCSCCGETNEKFLTLDHINRDGAEMRKVHGDGYQFHLWLVRNNFPPVIQVMCYNCNLGRERNGGVCPHKTVHGGSEIIPQGSTPQANGGGSAKPCENLMRFAQVKK